MNQGRLLKINRLNLENSFLTGLVFLSLSNSIYKYLHLFSKRQTPISRVIWLDFKEIRFLFSYFFLFPFLICYFSFGNNCSYASNFLFINHLSDRLCDNSFYQKTKFLFFFYNFLSFLSGREKRSTMHS